MKIDRNDWINVVRKDHDWIKETIGVDGTTWMLQKQLYSDEEYKKLTEYRSESLIEWISGSKGRKTNHWETPKSIDLNHLERLSNEKHRMFVGDAVPEVDIIGRDKRNVYDFFYTNLINNPRNTVADIGAGYARNSFLFVENGSNYICIDGVEKCYMMQTEVLNKLYGKRVIDYINNQDLTRNDISSLLSKNNMNDPIILHIPTWRQDLIPDSCVDLSMFVYSLEEMPVKTARFCLNSAVRYTSEEGILYLRGLFTRDINCLHPEIYAKFNKLYKALDLRYMYLGDAPGQTFVFRKDNRALIRKIKDTVHPWRLYLMHWIKSLKGN